MPTELQNRQHYQPLEQLDHKQIQPKQHPDVNMAVDSTPPPNLTSLARKWKLHIDEQIEWLPIYLDLILIWNLIIFK